MWFEKEERMPPSCAIGICKKKRSGRRRNRRKQGESEYRTRGPADKPGQKRETPLEMRISESEACSQGEKQPVKGGKNG